MPCLAKPQTCKSCPLYGDGQGFVPDRLVEGAEVLYLAQNPGADEEAGRRLVAYHGKKDRVYEEVPPQPLIGPTGYTLEHDLLPFAKLRPSQVSYANVLRCRDGHVGKDGRWKKTNEMPKGTRLQEAVACCAQYLSVPSSTKLIVAAGTYSWEWTQGKGHPLKKWRGYCGPSKVQGVPVFATLHPASLFRSPKMKGATRKDFQRVAAILAGTWPGEMPGAWVCPQEHEIVEAQDAINRAIEEGTTRFLIDTEYIWKEDDVPGHHPLTVVGIIWRWRDGCFGVVQFDFRALTEEQKRMAMLVVDGICRQYTTIYQNAAADIPVLEYNGGLRREEYCKVEDLLLLHACLWPEQPHDLAFLKSIVGILRWPKEYMWDGGDLIEYNRSDLVDSLVAFEVFEKEALADKWPYMTYTASS